MSQAGPIETGADMEPRQPQAEQAHSFAIAAARIAADNKTENVCVLDLRGLSNLTDFFVIGTGTSDRQMHAVLDFIKEYGRTIDRRPLGFADSATGTWLLADYVDVIIHIFDQENRVFYDLDELWGDAPIVDWQRPADEGPANSEGQVPQAK